jgi:hypothetical protein
MSRVGHRGFGLAPMRKPLLLLLPPPPTVAYRSPAEQCRYQQRSGRRRKAKGAHGPSVAQLHLPHLDHPDLPAAGLLPEFLSELLAVNLYSIGQAIVETQLLLDKQQAAVTLTTLRASHRLKTCPATLTVA